LWEKKASSTNKKSYPLLEINIKFYKKKQNNKKVVKKTIDFYLQNLIIGEGIIGVGQELT